ncbi:hypothetical protein GMA1_37 [Gordonia phage GMA1]|uniref:hypothetical protein n=1 Tax=Gordonia phage GMA1 TaxID=1647470 RepID=UPI0007B64649|nr:hypothetical protein BH788_gp37 [Gordonia phage GMA1]AKJ72134.1 hypothetical protein GMA1_37 [Gordonia phage GMA1]
MSAIEEINAKLTEIGEETLPGLICGVGVRAWAELTISDGVGELKVCNADVDEFQEQGAVLGPLWVHHDEGGSAWLRFRGDASTTEAVFALLERALDFVRTETPVPL